MTPRRVAVTGMGLICPLGRDPEAVFRDMIAGRSGVSALDAFDTTGFEVKVAARVRDFDPGAALPGELGAFLERGLDRKTAFGLAAAEDALASAFGAAAPSSVPPARRGVHLATGLTSTEVPEAEQDFLAHLDGRGAYDPRSAGRAAARNDGLFAYRHMTDLCAALVARRAGAAGPVLTNHGACAAAAQAIGQAFHDLREGEIDLAVCGGFESMIHPFGVLSFALLGALSTTTDRPPEAVSRPFDRTRDGFVIGEGAAMFVLEPLDLALARGARPLAEIVGYGSSLDAFRVTAPAPHGAGAARAMRSALRDAGLPPEAVGYINAHGTATPLNDAHETEAIRAVFGGPGRAPPVSSTKSMIGHAVAAAGAVEGVAVVQALRHQVLPPTLNLRDPDPECDLDYVPLVGRPASFEYAVSNSFGFGGQNASLVFRRWEGPA